MRSRTGCLTCRQRKLKCDEQKPICGQCTKGNRQCQPSGGLTFRHQHNASMNAGAAGSPTTRNPSLSSFYSYKNTFDADTIWFTFFNTTNPYLDPGTPDLDRLIPSSFRTSYTQQHQAQWELDRPLQDHPIDTRLGLHSHGLEALSAAALYSPPEANMIPRRMSDDPSQSNHPIDPSPSEQHDGHSASLGTAMAPTNNLNFLLNPASALDSPIDPNLMSSAIDHPPTPDGPTSSSKATDGKRADGEVESEQKVAHLLRHFSESPGHWMDLFDFGNYFGSYVPVRARSVPILKHSACAYAAQHLSRVENVNPTSAATSSKHTPKEFLPDLSADWEWEGAYHYDKGIALLMDAMRHDYGGPQSSIFNAAVPASSSSALVSNHFDIDVSARASANQVLLNPDEVAAAEAILYAYEFIGGAGVARSRHINGTKSLLDVSEGTRMPLGMAIFYIFFLNEHWSPSEGRRAAFWNFARQDYLQAFNNECQTRLHTDDLQLWRNAGLLLSNEGLVLPSNVTETGQSVNTVMKEDMISNALIWLSSRLCNFIAAGEDSNPAHTGDRTGRLRDGKPGDFGESQKSLLERWERLNHEIDLWFQGLPSTFKPSGRVQTRIQRPFADVPLFPPAKTNEHPFDKIRYNMPMCGATMMHYHMARILLLMNKPHETTARRSTIANRLSSYREIEEEVVRHCYEICGIASARPAASVRIHAIQPLYVAGQCLTHHRERKAIFDLLKDIKTELGWPTQYRLRQLENEWGWVSDV